MRLRRIVTATSTAIVLALTTAGVAAADQVTNTLDASVDAIAEVMPLNAGGATGSTTFAVDPSNGDGKAGCNLTGSTVLTVSVTSSSPAVATVSPASITFTKCGASPTTLTVTPLTVGATTVSLAQTVNTTDGTFDLAPATFTVNVSAPAPANTAPVLSISGVANGGAYDVGSVPVAICDVADAEDGNSSFAATLSAVTGPDAADGIGSQTASCSYTDGGGLTASASATYSIVDPTPPTIGYVLTPAAPDGDNDWYVGTVSLIWIVADNESPTSLVTTGCDPVTVTADQLASDYTCAASSAGGTATPQTVSIQRDGNGPTVAYDSVVSGTAGADGWYTSDVTVRFTDTDAYSGPVVDYRDVTTSGEGASVTAGSPSFSDNAGNVTPAGAATSPAFKIDKTAPHDLAFVGGPVDGGSYYYGSVPAAPTCSATDDVSGLSSCVVTGDATPGAVGTHTYTATATDRAGNHDSIIEQYSVLAWTDTGFYAPVNMGGVLNTVKGGSTVPMKFNVYAGSTELTDTAVVKSFTTRTIGCSDASGLTDPVEVTSTGGTSLRYDTTGHQFIQNWKTPTGAGTCYAATMTTQDGTTLTALFKIK
jgi:hypothetical protein